MMTRKISHIQKINLCLSLVTGYLYYLAIIKVYSKHNANSTASGNAETTFTSNYFPFHVINIMDFDSHSVKKYHYCVTKKNNKVASFSLL